MYNVIHLQMKRVFEKTMKEFARAFYTSPAWRKARRAYIAKRKAQDGGLCEKCNDALGYIVHHIVWLTPENINDVNVSLNQNNMQYVCLKCHNGIKDMENREGLKRRYAFDGDGNIVFAKTSE